jgi:hypothetical protein
MSLSDTQKYALIAAAAGGALYFFLHKTNPYAPYDPYMRMDSYVFHNDLVANKRWWDNQSMRMDHRRESPPETIHSVPPR